MSPYFLRTESVVYNFPSFPVETQFSISIFATMSSIPWLWLQRQNFLGWLLPWEKKWEKYIQSWFWPRRIFRGHLQFHPYPVCEKRSSGFSFYGSCAGKLTTSKGKISIVGHFSLLVRPLRVELKLVFVHFSFFSHSSAISSGKAWLRFSFQEFLDPLLFTLFWRQCFYPT